MTTTNMPRRPTIDITLLVCIILLIGIGFGFLYSASQPSGAKYYDNPYYFIIKQGIYLSIGLVFFIAGFLLDHRTYDRFIKFIVGGTIFLLVLTLIPGISKEVGGARRWIVVAGFQFQPSEIAKLTVVLYLGSVLAGKKENIKDFYKGVLPPLFIVGIICFLVFMENDFSTTFLILAVTILLFYLADVRLLTLFMMIGVGLTAGIMMIFFAPYRIKRLFAFINPWEDPLGTGWHYIQSMKCFSLGGWFGTGIGESNQKYFALPEAHNDYIYAIIGEEGGVFATVIVLALFMMFAFIGFNIAKRTDNKYSFLVAAGITSLIFIQAMVNIGVVLGVLPATGVTLPFVSAGGTSLIVLMFSAGIMMNISHRSRKKEHQA
jgi:cell division protein FtsW